MRKLTTVVVALLLMVGLVVGCGGGDNSSSQAESKFANTFEGKYFKIGYPEGWEVNDESTNSTMFQQIQDDTDELDPGDIIVITIVDEGTPETKRGNLKEIEKEMMEEADSMGMSDLKTSITIFAGEKALKSIGTFFVPLETYTIPMDGWTISVSMMGSNNIAKKILETFMITDPNYSGSPEAIDF